MPHAIPFPPPGFDELDIDAQYAYLRDLEDYLYALYDEVPQWQLEIVRERLAEHRANPTDTVPGEVVMAEALRRLNEISKARRESA